MILVYYFILVPLLAIMGYYLLNNLRKFVIIGIFYLSFFINSLPWEILPFSGVAMSSLYFFIFLSYVLLLFNRTIKYRWNNYLSLLIILLLTMTLNIGFAEPSNYGTEKTFLFFIKCVIPIITMFYLSPFNYKEKRTIIITLIVGGLVTSLKLLVFGDLTAERAVFADTNPITIGREIGIGLTVSVIVYLTSLKYKIFGEKKLVILLLLLIMILSTTSLIFTGSRGPILSVVMGVITGMIFSRMSFKVKMKNVIIILMFSMIVIIFNLLNVNFETTSASRIINQFEDFGDNASDQARFLKFDFALEGYQSSPFFGVGTGKYYTISPLIREGDYPHNLLLEIMAEQGLFGMLIMILIIITISIQGYKLYRRKNSYFPILIGLVIYSFINSMVSRDIPANSAFWISSVLLWAFENDDKDVEKNE